jgi:hypothetical protein
MDNNALWLISFGVYHAFQARPLRPAPQNLRFAMDLPAPM